MRLGKMTWMEAQAHLDSNGSRGLLVPVGTCEQHSRHLPLDTDIIVAEHLADYLSERTGMLVAPTVNYGVNLPCDREFAGTGGIDEQTLRNTARALADGWQAQGFNPIFLITAHGDPLHLRALSLPEYPQIHLLELYELDLRDILSRQTEPRHACEAETSVMLQLFPRKVRQDLIEDFSTPFEQFEDYLWHRKEKPLKGSPGC